MSRKDYRAFADILAGDLATCETDGERRKVACIALSMEDVFKRDNPRFDRQRFREAVGLDPWNPTHFGDDREPVTDIHTGEPCSVTRGMAREAWDQ